jgi:hypothetical protein
MHAVGAEEAATFGDKPFARLSHAPGCPPRQRGFTRPERPGKGDPEWCGGPSEGEAEGRMA